MAHAAAMIVYGYAGSINVRKVLWACDELGLAYAREDWGGATRSLADPAFRALTPVGMVPVLDDDGVIVWESNTIVRYLAASRGRVDLVPEDPAERSRVERWMDWQGSDYNNTWRYAFQALVRRNPAFGDPEQIERSKAAFTVATGIVDGQLQETGAYIAGSRFTAADLAIGLAVQRWLAFPFAAGERPVLRAVLRYHAQLCERAGFVRHGRDGGP
jgi:glutathione S-transferase